MTLLGQTVNAYGRDLTPPTDLAALLEQVSEVEGIARIRFTTSNPYNLTPRLVRALRDVPKVCEYFHLPLQSGSNRVLARMNRGYTREHYLGLIDDLRAAVPDMALSTDLIVGFPGETEADFAETLDMVERVGYDNVFVFRYSRRPGTAAASCRIRCRTRPRPHRNTRVLEVAHRVAAERGRQLTGRVMEVLVDGRAKKDASELAGRTRCNRVVNFDGRGRVRIGDVVPVRITDALPHSLRGTLASLPGGCRMFVEMKVRGLAFDPVSNMPIIILRDEEDKRSLPIWVGIFEANAIALELEKIAPPRPLTHDLIKNILETIEARVLKIVVTDLRENTFFADLHLKAGGDGVHGRLAALRRHRARPPRGRAHLRRRGRRARRPRRLEVTKEGEAPP